jgi:hypothetical protein
MEKIGFTSKGYPFTYDDIDSNKIEPFGWHYNHGYLARQVRFGNGRRKTIWMHHAVAGRPKTGLDIDHVNRIKNDNTRKNLRPVTKSQNGANKGNRLNSTGFRGVKLRPKKQNIKKPYEAMIKINKKTVSLGYFETPEEAHQAYLSKRSEHYGDFYIHPQL